MHAEAFAWLALIAVALACGELVGRSWGRYQMTRYVGDATRTCEYCTHFRGHHLVGPEVTACTVRGCNCEEFIDAEDVIRCHVCGCTDARGCVDEGDGTACYWVRVYPPERALCSTCVQVERALDEAAARRPLTENERLLGQACQHCPHGRRQHEGTAVSILDAEGCTCWVLGCDCPGYEAVPR